MRHTNKIVLTGMAFVALALVMSMAVGSVAASDGEDHSLVFENQSLNDNGEVTVEINESVAEDGNYVFVTYLDEDRPGSPETILAGLTELGENDTVATVEIEDDGGYPGEHTAHVISELSVGTRYRPGKVGISETTLSNVIVSETAEVSDEYDVYEPTTDVATVTFENQTSSDGTVVVQSATLPEGGFVTMHDDTLLDGDALGSVVGTSDYLEPGEHEDIEIDADLHDEEGGEHAHTYIAMPHFDTNGNEEYDFVDTNGSDDGPYTANGSAVVDDGVVTVGTSTDDNETDDGMDDDGMDDDGMDDDGMDDDGMDDDGMDDDGMDDDGMDDGSDDSSMDDGGEDGNESEDGGDDGGQGMPGFTAVAGLVALLSVALIAARRNE